VAELQTGVGTMFRNKAIWLSNREDVVVGHYTPDAHREKRIHGAG
jgi:hypothetical protein